MQSRILVTYKSDPRPDMQARIAWLEKSEVDLNELVAWQYLVYTCEPGQLTATIFARCFIRNADGEKIQDSEGKPVLVVKEFAVNELDEGVLVDWMSLDKARRYVYPAEAEDMTGCRLGNNFEPMNYQKEN